IYLRSKGVLKVDMIKVDIEGGELAFLKGAAGLLSGPDAPLILMEMALNTTKVFGYLPNDLMRFLESCNPYRFYRIDEVSRRLFPIREFRPDDIGANVLCVPQAKDHLLGRIDSRIATQDSWT
ncbi:MAG: FkbM family methyltransferase, partial [Pyrinomonadaceae bacterium]